MTNTEFQRRGNLYETDRAEYYRESVENGINAEAGLNVVMPILDERCEEIMKLLARTSDETRAKEAWLELRAWRVLQDVLEIRIGAGKEAAENLAELETEGS
jgi:uncharacterized protein YciU (UPF0263 family)